MCSVVGGGVCQHAAVFLCVAFVNWQAGSGRAAFPAPVVRDLGEGQNPSPG